MSTVLKRRFQELWEQAKTLEASKRVSYNTFSETREEDIDSNALLNWKTKADSLLSKACGERSSHYTAFRNNSSRSIYSSNLDDLTRMMAVFEAAKEDFEGGYLQSVHDLVRADIFSSELEQANELLKSKYDSAAAVIAGVVLETTLRELCTRNNIAIGKLDKMNADLAKADVYNGIVQKRVTHLAAIRNAAAHGNDTEFRTYDVKAMIEEIEQFLAANLH